MFFHYIYKDTVLHKMDGRLKVLSLAVVSLAVGVASEVWHYGVLFCLLGVALGIARVPIRAWLRDMRFFAVIIVVVMGVNVLTGGGDPLVSLPGGSWFPAVEISGVGVIMGLRFAGRLLLVLMACSVMTATTSPMMFRDVVEWYLRPAPVVREGKAAMMITLVFVLIPVILDSYTEMRQAQRSRGVELRRNPLKRLFFIVFPLFGRTLRRADEIVYAMEARCYSEERTRGVFKAGKRDWGIVGVCLGVFGFICLIH